MDQLVEDRMAEHLLGNCCGGQDDAGPEQSQQQGGGRQGVLVQLHGPPDAQLLPGPGQQVQQGGVFHFPEARPETAGEGPEACDAPYQQNKRPGQPEQDQRIRQVRQADGGGRRIGSRRNLRRSRAFRGRGGLAFRERRVCIRRVSRGGPEGGRGLRRLEQRPHGAALRREGQQQPEHGDEPDIVLPAPADPSPEQGPEEKQKQNR